MAEPRIALVCPTYGQFDYAMRTIESFSRHTADPWTFVVDDASPDWGDPNWQEFLGAGALPITVHRFPENGGLTRSWNWGIRTAVARGADYVIAGNSDILFCEGWHHGLIHALESGYALAGPITNAPGRTAMAQAHVATYYPGYQLTDDPAYLDFLSGELRTHYRNRVVEARVNGFFQMARAEVWLTGQFDEAHIYRPRNDFYPSGAPNPTPLMTFNEDELQNRWFHRGWRFAVCPSSFIFHYRAVSRGPNYLHGSWLRRTDS
ncbi:Glycosyltransferase, GT2 family [Singulisphaera sp. GP187]|uniref:glycosyltransferase family 2 protein n=1 Tax=Singulisphaera sp. GP187 TaxID=1882752 RepID=UPI000926E51C|nr:glycosyltransferase [Singulisphaera sp. GP187]SIO66413.1 Glycosyltransferase, GT2 family [Singulisphaera sp. GP187]